MELTTSDQTGPDNSHDLGEFDKGVKKNEH